MRLSENMHIKCLTGVCNRQSTEYQMIFHCMILSLLHSVLRFGSSDSLRTIHLSSFSQGSSSSDSLEGQSCDYASKSYDAVVFDVLRVTPEEFAVSDTDVLGGVTVPDGGTAPGFLSSLQTPYVLNSREC
jgi:hypothetical protein